MSYLWLIEVGLVVGGAFEAEGLVELGSVIEALGVIEDGGDRFAAGDSGATIDQFLFERAPERFHGGVVGAIALATHGGRCSRDRRGRAGNRRWHTSNPRRSDAARRMPADVATGPCLVRPVATRYPSSITWPSRSAGGCRGRALRPGKPGLRAPLHS